MLLRRETILVGVSGGPDSTALTYLLHALSSEYALKLHIAHLDHLLRRDSHKDAEFVQKLGEKLKIPVTCGKVDVKNLAKQGGSLEEIARNARLCFLFDLSKNIRADKIALGHNLDDQAETVLMRILRGSGLYGLAGILPKRLIAGHTIIRPLIETPRKEIEAYLKRKKIFARMDPSNSSDIYFRNKIRGELLPLLARRYNTNIKETLAHLAESAGWDYDYVSKAADARIRRGRRRLCLPRFTGNAPLEGRASDLNMLTASHPAIRRLLIRKAIAAVQGDTRRITFSHIREIEDLILNRPVNSIVDLPRDISVKKNPCSISIYRR